MEILDEVTAQIGQGGMRGVSRARDLKPKRTVARRQLPVPFRAMMRMIAAIFLAALVTGTEVAVAQQPAFAPGSGPTVLFDLGHNNDNPNTERVMARLRDDGYVTQRLMGPFTEEALAGVDIVITRAPRADRDALPEDIMEWRRPIPSAFSVEEIDTLQAWVERGGGLFLAFDHFPTAGGSAALAGRFGIEVSHGFAADERLLPALPRETRPLLGQAGEPLVFRRVDQTLAEHPVTNGRSSAERVDAVVTWVGSAFRLPLGGQSLLTFGPSFVSLLPEVMWEFSEATPRQPVGGWSQGGLLRVGRGRLAVFGALEIFAMMGGRLLERYPDVQNPQLVLNVVHWLSGLADAEERRSPPLGLDVYMPIPEDDLLTPEKVALGRRLFSDTILSRDRRLACVTCHDPERAFTDGRPVSVGVFGRKGTRNVPTLVNRTYGASFFWDGRITTLEEQVLQPIQDPKEMDITVGEVVVRLERDQVYADLFQAAFGREVNDGDLAKALASYVRTILSGNAPIDRYLYGDRDALTERQRQGLGLFRGKAGCTACHLGPTLSDEQFHNTGVAWRDGRLLDQGRFAVTSQDEDRGAFKTPTLREVPRTAPYMHDGSIATLEEVIEFYDRGGDPNPTLDRRVRPLNLTAGEKGDLLAFLRALSGEIREGDQEKPRP